MKSLTLKSKSLEYLGLNLDCPECGVFIEAKDVHIEEMRKLAEKNSDGKAYLSDTISCACNRQFDFQVFFYNENLEITFDNLEQDYNVRVNEIYDWSDEELAIILGNTDFFYSFRYGMMKTMALYNVS